MKLVYKYTTNLHDTYWERIVSGARVDQVFRYNNHHFFCSCCVPKFRNQMYLTTRPYVRSGYDMWNDKTVTLTKKVFVVYNRKDWDCR